MSCAGTLSPHAVNNTFNLSTTLAALTANGTYTAPSSVVTITGTDPTSNVIQVPAAVLTSASAINVNVPDGSTVIINVTGTTVMLNTALTITGVTSGSMLGHVLWNFPQATYLYLENTIMLGTVLAPSADVELRNAQTISQVIGQVILPR